jgi:hypothetical protein
MVKPALLPTALLNAGVKLSIPFAWNRCRLKTNIKTKLHD